MSENMGNASNNRPTGSPDSRQARQELASHNLAWAEDLYLRYLKDPDSVPAEWRDWFREAEGAADTAEPPRGGYGPGFETGSLFRPAAAPGGAAADDAAAFQHRVDALVRSYRVRGHTVADVNPLFRTEEQHAELGLDYHGFTAADLDRPVVADNMSGVGTLGELIEALQATYTRSIGVQFMHIDSSRVRSWLQARMERTRNRLDLARDTQLRILTRLTDATIFEEFILRKFVGAKSFSLQGGETLIPLLDLAIEKAGEQGIRDIVLAMAHRGRLNVLANIMGKSPRTIFREFEDVDPELHRGRGDVKYHLGYSSDWATEAGNEVHLSLSFNPSHLEFVNPVAVGRTRAKQDRDADAARAGAMPIIIHGDAAIIGQGVNQETFNMSGLEGYEVGGSLHIVVNNQIGFTTGPDEGRSTMYASDIAKMIQSPIFHVNGEDPEAVAQVIQLAMEFRREFRRDVVIDMFSYRRMGHNEGDEPAFTQPLMYDLIRKRQGVREGYLDRLLELGGITREEAEEIAETRRQNLEEELITARREDFQLQYSSLEGSWTGYRGGLDEDTHDVDTGIPEEAARDILGKLSNVPEGFNLNPRLQRLMTGRAEMAAGERPLDWAAGEHLAFASLLAEGRDIRMTGQDSQRGTFSHRHAVLHDVENGQPYMPLKHISEDQGNVEIHNSPLSETSALGFEYGYSLDLPESLVIWEA
ncbi:MAG TPA: 2-oxoglutarate dehydrogenase E1 component, partial [Deinococcales bacterium]|nr:2-oxoglutarate dehydrogenase E1 component [Deinococcales bacterium]